MEGAKGGETLTGGVLAVDSELEGEETSMREGAGDVVNGDIADESRLAVSGGLKCVL